MIKTRSVSAINNGIVIDHITAGQALKVMRLLHVVNDKQRVTLGLNLMSRRLKLKDLIKIENRKLSSEEINQVSVFAASATINHVENFVVYEKIKCQLPETIRDVLMCPNLNCISRLSGKSYFKLEEQSKEISLYCFYCEKQFEHDQFAEVSL
jgi:aspartate carbamoyltransferase regulatory subunit